MKSDFLLLDWLPYSSLPYYLLITEKRIVGFIPFARILVLYDKQTASFKILTCVVLSIS